MLCATLLTGCKKDLQNEEAVRQGVMKYLLKRPDLLAMDVRVVSVSFRKDEADAKVHFQAKGATNSGAGLEMGYTMEQKGGEWVVKGRTGGGAAMGSNPHGGGAMPPNTLPPMPGGNVDPMSTGTLPPGHPPIPDQSK